MVFIGMRKKKAINEQAPEKSGQGSLEKAVALRYDQEKESSPRVVAKGQGNVARQIKERAALEGIPIRRDDDLVELLAQVDLDKQIPAELFAAVAEILSWLYRANEEMKKESA